MISAGTRLSIAASAARKPVSRQCSLWVGKLIRYMPAPAPARLAIPMFETVLYGQRVVGFVDNDALYCRSVTKRPAVTPAKGTSQVESTKRMCAGLVQICFWSFAKSEIAPPKKLFRALSDGGMSASAELIVNFFESATAIGAPGSTSF